MNKNKIELALFALRQAACELPLPSLAVLPVGNLSAVELFERRQRYWMNVPMNNISLSERRRALRHT